MTTDNAIRLFQIFYDDVSALQIEPGFEPLNNCDGPAEFREIVPMFRYLKETPFMRMNGSDFFRQNSSRRPALTRPGRAAVASCDKEWMPCSSRPSGGKFRVTRVFGKRRIVHPGLIKVSQSC